MRKFRLTHTFRKKREDIEILLGSDSWPLRRRSVLQTLSLIGVWSSVLVIVSHSVGFL